MDPRLPQRPDPEETNFLEGPERREIELLSAGKIFLEFLRGFGTLDEVFETATLIQTHKIQDFPLVLLGEAYWRPLVGFLRDTLIPAGTIDAADFQHLHITDDPHEAVEYVKDVAMRQFGLK